MSSLFVAFRVLRACVLLRVSCVFFVRQKMAGNRGGSDEIGTPEERAKLLKEIFAMSQSFVVVSDKKEPTETKSKAKPSDSAQSL